MTNINAPFYLDFSNNLYQVAVHNGEASPGPTAQKEKYMYAITSQFTCSRETRWCFLLTNLPSLSFFPVLLHKLSADLQQTSSSMAASNKRMWTED